MPLAQPKQATNPILDRIKADGIFNGGGMQPGVFEPGQVQPGPDIGQISAMANAGQYMPGTFGASNAVANGTGSVFGGGMDPTTAPTAGGVAMPPNPFGGGMASPAPAANPFGGGMPPAGMVGVNPIHAYAPTGLAQRAIAAGGQGVWGQGDVMAFHDGMNAQGGNKFTLSQVMPVGGPNGGPVQPANPIGPETLRPAGYRPANPGSTAAKPSPNAGLLAAFDPDSAAGRYVAAQEAAHPGQPIDMDHLKLLATVTKNEAAHALNEKKVGLAESAATDKKTAASQKLADAAQGHAATLAQINEQNDAVMTNIDDALKLADAAGPVGGRLVGLPGGDEVTQLHGLVESIAGNEMMDYIQRLKNANPQGTIGFRVLQSEAQAMSNVFAAIKDPKVPLERQSPEFVKKQLGKLKFHLTRMNAIANGKDPDSVSSSGSPAAPAGVDAAVWGAMTPEERKLFQ